MPLGKDLAIPNPDILEPFLLSPCASFPEQVSVDLGEILVKIKLG